MSAPSPEADIQTQGLSCAEARLRLLKYGKNEIIPSELNSTFYQILKFFKDPMGLMLLALALIYFLLDEKNNAIIMLIAFIPVSTIDVFLELRAEKTLKSLKTTFQSKAKVFRDGKIEIISILEIVPGDIIALEEGQTIPADGIILSSAGLMVSEASLTGESVPIDKISHDELYTGTSILAGRGTYEVKITGPQTKFGKIIQLLQSSSEVQSPLQKKVNHLVLQILKIALILVVCLFSIELVQGKSILNSLLTALTFGMASVPEEFPLVFTLYLSLGAWRLTKSGVLVKSLPSVETLGSVDIICTDKTGTLTEGKFQLIDIIPFHEMEDKERWQYALLACEPIIIDSMEVAIRNKIPPLFTLSGWTLVHDYPFETEGKHMSHAWRYEKSGETLVTMKGAIEGVLDHCCLTKENRSKILKETEQLSIQGLRLLGLAGKKKVISGLRNEDEENLNFIGILAFSDPIRTSAKKAIQVCQSEGIEVKMITGDHPETAHNVADQLGLNHSHDALYTGNDLKRFSAAERIQAFNKGAIFSRVTPEQKYELVKVLKESGKIVAMTGDGINDTPAMKIADIGISMGENATDAARSTAKMILIKNDFNGIVQAIMEGRKIFSNLRKSFSYLISFHAPIVLLSFLPPLFGLGDVLLPIHVILLELIVHPVSAFTFENFNQKEYKKQTGIMNRVTLFTSLLTGILVSFIALLPFMLQSQSTMLEKRSIAFSILLLGNIGYILLETWPVFTKRLCLTILLLFATTLSVTFIPVLARLLDLTSISPWWIFIGLLLSLASFIPARMIRQQYLDRS